MVKYHQQKYAVIPAQAGIYTRLPRIPQVLMSHIQHLWSIPVKTGTPVSRERYVRCVITGIVTRHPAQQ